GHPLPDRHGRGGAARRRRDAHQAGGRGGCLGAAAGPLRLGSRGEQATAHPDRRGVRRARVAARRQARRGREAAPRGVCRGSARQGAGAPQEEAGKGLDVPKRHDIKTVMLIGSGPIVIGQACEFDYSGTQGVKALKEEGYRVVLVNSNPATIMTDPEIADRTYVEPLTVEVLTSVIERERPDALLPTLGGQTALNLALDLHKAGVLDGYAHSLEEARTIQARMAAETGVGYPVLLRPSFTLGGSGADIVWNAEEFDAKVAWGLAQSPRGEVLVEQSVLGWKEYELEVMRDKKDNAVIICSIENFDPMGVHTGDSITVAPAMTLTDKEYQIMRDAALAVIREIGVETGGSNIQFAVNPENGRMIVIEMNPRVSRSSALASKATGFPIAKIATK